MSDRLRPAYDRWAATYDVDPNPQTAMEFPALLEALAPTAEDVLLDAACGTGRYFPALAETGARVYGFDGSRRMLAQARTRRDPPPVVRADMTAAIPFADGTFSGILCAQALQHCRTLSVPIGEFARLLRAGGRLVASVPHPNMDFTHYTLRDPPASVVSGTVEIFRHSMDAYERAIDDAGLRLTEIIAVDIDDRAAPFLTAESLAKLRGQSQIAIFVARRPGHDGACD